MVHIKVSITPTAELLDMTNIFIYFIFNICVYIFVYLIDAGVIFGLIRYLFIYLNIYFLLSYENVCLSLSNSLSYCHHPQLFVLAVMAYYELN